MKVAFCINSLYHVGGSERVWINRVNYLIRNTNYEIYLITTDQDKRPIFYEIDSRIKLIDLEINYFKDKEKNFFKRIALFRKKQKLHFIKLKKVVEDIKPQIIIGHGTEEKWLLPKLGNKYKLILEHHLEKNFLKKSAKNILYKLKAEYFIKREEKLINKYDEFLVLTEEDKNQWKNEKIKVIPNPLSFYSDEVAKLENKVAISVGRLTAQKRYDLLIEIWNIVSKKFPEWKLKIYGEGEKREELENKIKKLKLEDKIFLMGIEKNIKEKYLESSMYIMTSEFEGMPMVLIEAMSCGLPLISFDCPCGPKDIIKTGENGYICRFGNIELMAKKICFLIENKNRRKKFGKKAREFSLNFEENKIMRQWKNLLEALVEN